MYKEDLSLDNLQWLICHKTRPNQTIQLMYKKLATVVEGDRNLPFP